MLSVLNVLQKNEIFLSGHGILLDAEIKSIDF